MSGTALGGSLSKAVQELQQILGLPPHFLDSLPKEDDWSFIVKLQALIESACTSVLIKSLGRPELEDVIAATPLAASKNGKVAMIAALGILDQGARRFIVMLASIRNKLVHDARNVNFDIASHIRNAKADQQREIAIAAMGDDLVDQFKKAKQDPIPLLVSDPKSWFWLAAVGVLGTIYLAHEKAELQAAMQHRIEEYIISGDLGMRGAFLADFVKSLRADREKD